MTDTIQIREDVPASMVTAGDAPLTPLARLLGAEGSCSLRQGARTLTTFSDASHELSALVTGAAAFDRGERVRLRITGEDRVRWLNGMVTNTVKSLAPGTHNYTFVLNAQGRIQGDATVFCFADHLLLETDRGQAERLFTHLDRFIIMDDVELAWVDGETTLGVAGPGAEGLLKAAGLPTPEQGSFVAAAAPLAEGAPVTIVGEESGSVPRFSLWISEPQALRLWQGLLAAGATAAGALAVDALRVLEATPVYGVDISEKTLAQETGQMRALNFSKGCYLGQEIVERVRSRANVHRGIHQFALHGEPALPGASLQADGAAAGELSSVAAIDLPGWRGQVGLGLVRIELLQGPLSYAGGTAERLTRSPLLALTEKEA